MISNVSGFFLYSDGLFYISNERVDPCNLIFNKEDLNKEIIREILPFDIILSIKKPGLIEFDFSKWSKTKAVAEPTNGKKWNPRKEWNITKFRLLLMNVFLSIFYTKYERIHRINSSKVVITSKQQITRTNLDSTNIGFGSSATSELYISIFKNNHIINTLNWVKPEVIYETIKDFKILFHWKYKDYWYLIDTLSVSHLNHQNNHYSQSLVISWAVTESILTKLWNNNFIINTKYSIKQLEISIRKFNRKHDYNGPSPNNYNSYIKLKVLEDLSVISCTYARKLHKIREKRNDWIHELKEIKMKDSHEALSYSIDLLNKLMPINLTWHVNSSWYTG